MRPQHPIPEDRVNELMEFLKDVRDAQEYLRAQCVLLRIIKGMTAEQISPIRGYPPNRVRTFNLSIIIRIFTSDFSPQAY